MNDDVKILKKRENRIQVSQLGLEPGKNYVVTRGLHYLSIRSDDCWNEFEQKLRTLRKECPDDEKVRQLYYFFIGYADDCKVECDGYMEISINLLCYIAGDSWKNHNEIFAIQKELNGKPIDCYCIGFDVGAIKRNMYLTKY